MFADFLASALNQNVGAEPSRTQIELQDTYVVSDALRFVAGLGLRYETGFGPIRVDVGVPLNRRAGDAPVGVYVALGQAF